MSIRLAAVIAVLAAAVPAAAQTGAQNKTATAPKKVLTGDQFAAKVAASDMFEIESSRLAQTKAASPQVKEFAAMMVRDHTSSSAKLAEAAKSATPPVRIVKKLEPLQQAELKQLQNKPAGAAWDKAYVAAQLKAHEATLALLNNFAQTGAVPSLKAFAGETSKVVAAHHEHAKRLNAK